MMKKDVGRDCMGIVALIVVKFVVVVFFVVVVHLDFSLTWIILVCSSQNDET